MCVWVYVCMYARKCVCGCVYVVCPCVCMYTHTHTHVNASYWDQMNRVLARRGQDSIEIWALGTGASMHIRTRQRHRPCSLRRHARIHVSASELLALPTPFFAPPFPISRHGQISRSSSCLLERRWTTATSLWVFRTTTLPTPSNSWSTSIKSSRTATLLFVMPCMRYACSLFVFCGTILRCVECAQWAR